MPTIEISPGTLRRLQEQAEPLVDTFDSVIGRLLDASEAREGPEEPPRQPRPQRRAGKGEKTPNEAFYGPIVRVLREAGGELPTRQAVERVGQLVEHDLNEIDRGVLKSGEARWRNTVRWARNDLIKKGDLDPDAPHGTWRLLNGSS